MILRHKILISGNQGSGKDTVADYLEKYYGYKKLFFAQKIYDIAYDVFGMTTKDRLLLQQIGQKMREIDPEVWVRCTYEDSYKYTRSVISDCRQANEYFEGVRHGFFPIRVCCDEDTRIKRLTQRDGIEPDLSLMYNECETGADDFEYYSVDNNGSLEDLYKQIDEIIFGGD